MAMSGVNRKVSVVSRMNPHPMPHWYTDGLRLLIFLLARLELNGKNNKTLTADTPTIIPTTLQSSRSIAPTLASLGKDRNAAATPKAITRIEIIRFVLMVLMSLTAKTIAMHSSMTVGSPVTFSEREALSTAARPR